MKSCIEPSLPSQTAVKSPLFAILETIRRLVPNWSSKGLWDRYWGRACQLLANFFPVASDSPRSLCESKLDPVSFPSQKWRITYRVRPPNDSFINIFTVRITTDSTCAQCWYSRSAPGHYRQSYGSLGGVLFSNLSHPVISVYFAK